MDGDESPGGEGGRRWAKDQSGGRAGQLRTRSRQAVGRAPNRDQRPGARVWRTPDGDLTNRAGSVLSFATVGTAHGVKNAADCDCVTRDADRRDAAGITVVCRRVVARGIARSARGARRGPYRWRCLALVELCLLASAQ